MSASLSLVVAPIESNNLQRILKSKDLSRSKSSPLNMQTDGPEWLVGSVLGSLSCLMQHRGFGTPLGRIFSVEGIFPLELIWILTPFSPNSFG